MVYSPGVTFYVVVFGISLYSLKQVVQGPPCRSQTRMDDKVIIVTGGNSGIGKETVLDLVARGAKVYIACRSVERGEEARREILDKTHAEWDNLVVMKLDLSSLQSVRSFVEEFQQSENHLDILINNAGVLHFTETRTTVDGFEEMFGVNYLGHFLLTNLLLQHLLAAPSARVVTVTSLTHRLVDMNWEDLMHEQQHSFMKGFWCYAQSKLASILFTVELARRLEGTSVTTYATDPGIVLTKIFHGFSAWKYVSTLCDFFVYIVRWPISKSPYNGAQTQICCAVDDNLARTSGKYYSDCDELQPSAGARSAEAANRLWEISTKLVNLSQHEIHTQVRNPS